MSNQVDHFGLDKELADKRALAYDHQAEKEARLWISEILGENLEGGSFHDILRDGIVLVKLANRVCNANMKATASKMPFKHMENINNFLIAIEKLGVPKHDSFQTVDLYEQKNMGQVLQTIFALSRHATKNGFTGPSLGAKLSEQNPRNFTVNIPSNSSKSR
jgi:hypothetical protein